MASVSKAVEARNAAPDTPGQLIKRYEQSFAEVLPSHIKPETWVRLAQGALKKGKRGAGGKFELEIAAGNNPGQFLATLLDAARMGLEPGTDEYYLTPRKIDGKLQILGIPGYMGYVEQMYRAGAVASVVVEVVRANDSYQYRRGIDEIPIHEFPSFASEESRGKLVGVYAYARMKDGGYSRVVELGQDDIDRIKKSATAADSGRSPWTTNEPAMWLKSAVRQLRKWVPTSAEYRREQLRALAEAQRAKEQIAPEAPAFDLDVDPETGQIIDDEPRPEAEVTVEDPPPGWETK